MSVATLSDALSAELCNVIAAVAVTSQNELSFAGVRISAVHAANAPSHGSDSNSDALTSALQQHLYDQCYARRFTGTLRPVTASAPDPLFIERLARANTSRDRWSTGWRIDGDARAARAVVARKNGSARLLYPGEFVARDPAAGLQDGVLVDIKVARESRALQPAFYCAFGEALMEQPARRGLLRFYLNVRHEGAATLVKSLTSALNRFRLPFALKCLNSPPQFDRVDSAVLYIKRCHYRIAAELVADTCLELGSELEPETPLFTKRLAPGVALAEDPGGSFGMSRCLLLAQGLNAAFTRGIDNLPGRLQEIAGKFEARGLSLERPYLDRVAQDDYDFPA